MSEITASPTQVAWDHSLPAGAYPKAAAAQIKVYEAAHLAWTSEYAALAAAEAAVPQAAAEDDRALSVAVASGKTDDGGREVKAKRAVVVANERTAQARDKATAQTDVLKAALATAGPELLPHVIANIRALTDAYEDALSETQRIVRDAATALQDARSAGLRLIAPTLRDVYGVIVGESAGIEAPTWPRNPVISIRTSLDRIEATVTRATTNAA